jgi:hypothetical protein
MAQLTQEEKAFMNGLFNKYDLSVDDIFRHQHFVIIKRQGVEKIMARAEIQVDYTVEACARDYAAVKATASSPQGKSVTTFGSASPDNCRSPYFLEMAEKRAKSRSVLMLCGLYEHGVYSEVEEAHIDR